MKINTFKKIITLIYLITVLFSLFVPFNQSSAQNAGTPVEIEGSTTYEPLVPYPGLDGPIDVGDGCAFGKYLNIMIKLVLGLSAVLAMVMITMGGIEYMTSDLVSSKEAGKETITHAILGLVIALGAYMILFTINPQLLNLCLELPSKEIGGESPDIFVPIEPVGESSLASIGIDCPRSGGKPAIESIGRQFIGKTIYSQAAGKRNKVFPPKVFLDCSAFVAQVYRCAGLSYPGGTTTEIFGGNSTSVDGKTYDFTQLHTGDLIGWKPSDDPKGNGHVSIYIEHGKILDTQPGGTAIRSLSSIKNRVKWVKWSR